MDFLPARVYAGGRIALFGGANRACSASTRISNRFAKRALPKPARKLQPLSVGKHRIPLLQRATACPTRVSSNFIAVIFRSSGVKRSTGFETEAGIEAASF
jgi:hypothetical protein